MYSDLDFAYAYSYVVSNFLQTLLKRFPSAVTCRCTSKRSKTLTYCVRVRWNTLCVVERLRNSLKGNLSPAAYNSSSTVYVQLAMFRLHAVFQVYASRIKIEIRVFVRTINGITVHVLIIAAFAIDDKRVNVPKKKKTFGDNFRVIRLIPKNSRFDGKPPELKFLWQRRWRPQIAYAYRLNCNRKGLIGSRDIDSNHIIIICTYFELLCDGKNRIQFHSDEKIKNKTQHTYNILRFIF